MFDAIAPRYDLLNTYCRAGSTAAGGARHRSLELTGRETLLDVCTGTADVALAARGRDGAARVVGVDFAGAMLALGVTKMRAPAVDARVAAGPRRRDAAAGGRRVVDAVTVAFGIRNVQQPEVACARTGGCSRPGGRLAILEFGAAGRPGACGRSTSGTSTTCCRGSAARCPAQRRLRLPAAVGRQLSAGARHLADPARHRIFTGRSPAR